MTMHGDSCLIMERYLDVFMIVVEMYLDMSVFTKYISYIMSDDIFNILGLKLTRFRT